MAPAANWTRARRNLSQSDGSWAAAAAAALARVANFGPDLLGSPASAISAWRMRSSPSRQADRPLRRARLAQSQLGSSPPHFVLSAGSLVTGVSAAAAAAAERRRRKRPLPAGYSGAAWRPRAPLPPPLTRLQAATQWPTLWRNGRATQWPPQWSRFINKEPANEPALSHRNL